MISDKKHIRYLNSVLKFRYNLPKICVSKSRILQGKKLVNDRLLSAIDYIENADHYPNKSLFKISPIEEWLFIKGWSIDYKNKKCPQKVFIEIDNQLFESENNKFRADVAQTYKNENFLNCGIEVSIPSHFITRAKHNLRIIVLFDDNTYSVGHTTVLDNRYIPYDTDEDNPINDKIDYLTDNLISKDQHINLLYASKSWKLTAFLRSIESFFKLSILFLNPQNIKIGFRVIRAEGFKAFFRYLKLYLKQQRSVSSDFSNKSDYQKYFESQQANEIEKKKIIKEYESFDFQPKISIILPVYNVDSKWLNKCIESVVKQFYNKWELCIVDDASDNNSTIECLKFWQKNDPRIKIKFSDTNNHISISSNLAIEMASGEYVGLLDHDDELTPDALYEVVKSLNVNNKIDFIYSDEDKIDINGNLSGPYFKSDFNPDLLLSNNYITHFAVIRKSLGDKINWFRKGYEGAQDHDLFLRIIESEPVIHHIPKVLYHWRQLPGSTAYVHSEKSYANKAGMNALKSYVARNNIDAEVFFGNWKGAYRVKRTIKDQKKVSIIIPFKDKLDLLKNCVTSILEKTSYSNYELLLINNNSVKKSTFEYIESLKSKDRIKILDFNSDFNFSAINNWAVSQSDAHYVSLLNNDIEVIEAEWLDAMIEHAQRPEVGVVGAKLLYPDNKIQHAGIILGINGTAGHSFKGFPGKTYHHFSMGVIKNVSAVTGACLLCRKEVYEEIGGLDENNLKIAFNDVDFCLKVREKGYLITYTPYSILYHHESASRGYETTPEKKERFEKEKAFLQDKWKDRLDRDPYYNPNLTKKKEDFSLKEIQWKS